MFKKMRSFFLMVLAPESLAVKGAEPSRKLGSFFSEILRPEKLPAAKTRQNTGRNFISELLSPEKIPSRKIR
jgi:hypothetical protein